LVTTWEEEEQKQNQSIVPKLTAAYALAATYVTQLSAHLFGPYELGVLRARIEELHGSRRRVSHGVDEQRLQELHHLDAHFTASLAICYHSSE